MSPEDGRSHTAHLDALDMPDATVAARPDHGFTRADLTTFCRLDELGLEVTGQRLAPEPLGWRPTTLAVTIRRYRCAECSHVWRQDITRAVEPRAKLSRRGLRWALEGSGSP